MCRAVLLLGGVCSICVAPAAAGEGSPPITPGIFRAVDGGYAPFLQEPAVAVPHARDDVRSALQAALDAIPPHEIAKVQSSWLTPLELPSLRRREVVPWLLLVNLLIAAALAGLLWMRHRLVRRSRRLSRTQRLLEHTSRSALVGGWEYEQGGDEVVWTAECHAVHGSQPGSIRTRLEDCLALVDESSREMIRTSIEKCLREGVPFDHVFRLRRADGSEIWAGLSGEPERENGRIVRISGSLRNIDELVRRQIDLERSEKLYRALAHGTSDLVSVHDRSGVFLYASPSALNITGYSPEELVGRNVDEFRPADRRASFEEVRADIDACKGTRGGKYRFLCKDGSIRWCEYRASILEGSELEGEILLVSRDITERLAAEERFRYLALHDALTGLPNRIAFSERLSELVAVASKTRSSLAVCFLDADNFKAINDERGHPVGDEVIKVLAERLRAAAGADHLVSRLEGDEFSVLIRPPAAVSVAVAAAQKLIESVSAPIDLQDGPVVVTASVGIALFPDDGKTAEELLSAADTAMDAAKADGKNTYRRYDSALGRASLARARALQNVRGALDRGELELFYQPKVRLRDGSISGLEALLRWRSAEGYRGPKELIEAAEESGAIRRLGRWVLETAAVQMGEWSASGIDVPVAVNVSVRQLHDSGFLAHLRNLVAKNPGLAGRLQLEITETAIATDVEAVPALLQQVRDLRIGLHIDDFGTGYSSLSYLGRLPVDTLKIDRSIVAEATDKRDACEVARAIIALGSALGLETVAEGVETPEHASFLRESGCSQAQGYLFARPMPAREATRFLRQRTLPRPTEIVEG
jgi:diguanylate cyclase (GGDEF)-like protein/PAS domain S-box-containing protein